MAIAAGRDMALEPQGIRFVLYPVTVGALPEAAEVWKKILPDREASTIQRGQQVAPGIVQSLAQGVLRGLSLTVTTQPGRLDILVGRIEPWFNDGSSRPSELEELLKPIEVYGGKCAASYSNTRLALVLDAVSPASGWEDANEQFRAAVPALQLPIGCREATVALNAPRPFDQVPLLEMNRLCRWEAALFHFLLIAPGAAAVGQSSPTTRHALTVQFDLSSELRVMALDANESDAILKELVAETRLLMAGGYPRLNS